MKVENRKVYIANDGKIFEKEKECIDYEKKFANLRYTKVYAYPDLTEGRHGPRYIGVVKTNIPFGDIKLLVEHWCYKKFGSRCEFVQGAQGIPSWRVGDILTKVPEDSLILGEVTMNGTCTEFEV